MVGNRGSQSSASGVSVGRFSDKERSLCDGTSRNATRDCWNVVHRQWFWSLSLGSAGYHMCDTKRVEAEAEAEDCGEVEECLAVCLVGVNRRSNGFA